MIRTTGRDCLAEAVRSVYAQRFDGRVQILIGVDKGNFSLDALGTLFHEDCPANMAVSVFDPGYSTAARNGGMYSNGCGGALLAILAFLANAPRLINLDDDNRIRPDHLAALTTALGDKAWAYSLRWFTNPVGYEPICIDRWESVGPGRGAYAGKFGGHVDMNSWMIDKRRLHRLIPAFTRSMFADGAGEDRVMFGLLKGLPHGETNMATSDYVISPNDQNHAQRLGWFRAEGYDVDRIPRAVAGNALGAGYHGATDTGVRDAG